MKGKLYGVGVGPGDPQLLTLKAREVLSEVDYICTPRAGKDKKSRALQIVEQVVDCGDRVKGLHFPMTSDPEKLQKAHRKAAAEIAALLKAGYSLAFITLGDPLLYSTYIYLLQHLQNYPRLEVETIPGINAASAAAARLNQPLASGEEKLLFYPLPQVAPELDSVLKNSSNIVFFKVSHNYELLIEKLEEHGRKENSYLVSNCGQEGELVASELDSFFGKKVPYFSLVITKRKRDKK